MLICCDTQAEGGGGYSHRRLRWWFHILQDQAWRNGSCLSVCLPSGRCQKRRYWSGRETNVGLILSGCNHCLVCYRLAWNRAFPPSPQTCPTAGCSCRWWTWTWAAIGQSCPSRAAEGFLVALPQWLPAQPTSRPSPPCSRLDPTESGELAWERPETPQNWNPLLTCKIFQIHVFEWVFLMHMWSEMCGWTTIYSVTPGNSTIYTS